MGNARNAEQFIAAVKAHCGVSIEVISGEEGRLDYLAVQAGLGLPDVTLMVIYGGGSIQFNFGHGYLRPGFGTGCRSHLRRSRTSNRTIPFPPGRRPVGHHRLAARPSGSDPGRRLHRQNST